MRKLSADHIFPISSPPLRNGVVIADDDGHVLDVLGDGAGLDDVEHYEGVICPGFVNAHCHLELSYLKGNVPEGGGLHHFIRNIEDIRGGFSDETRQDAMVEAESEMIANGIVAVGDIVNGRSSFSLKERSRLQFHNFIEVFAFDPNRAEAVFTQGTALYDSCPGRKSITPHAPYSASGELLKMIAAHAEKTGGLLSFHNQESGAENDMFLEGEGEILDVLGTWNDTSWWRPAGKSSMDYMLQSLPEKNKKLLVHNTFTTEQDLQASHLPASVSFCFCPNANRYIEGRLPDIELFIANGCNILLGTDSYASNWSMSIVDEMKTIHRHAPGIPLNMLLTWATKNGADFFGFEGLGGIEKGKTPGINLITGVDSQKLLLNPLSRVKRIL